MMKLTSRRHTFCNTVTAYSYKLCEARNRDPKVVSTVPSKCQW